MLLGFSELVKFGEFPRMRHGRDINIMGRERFGSKGKVSGRMFMGRNLLKGIDLVLDSGKEIAVESLDHHDLGAFMVVGRHTV